MTSAAVAYPPPVVTNGTAPVATTCSAASNSSFSAGTTEVSCTATDAATRSAICYFKVTVNVPAPPIPAIQFTKYLAFGDSITAGDNGCNIVNDPFCIFLIDDGYQYPKVLGQLLSARYIQQAIPEPINDGRGGEYAYQGARRIAGDLDLYRPEILLLLEGVNDLRGGASVADVIQPLREDIQAAKALGLKVLISTLTPTGSCAYPVCRNDVPALKETNDRIRGLAAEQGVILVDGYAALSRNLSADIAADGLHLTRAGRADLAQAFFDAIKANFETGTTAATRRAIVRR